MNVIRFLILIFLSAVSLICATAADAPAPGAADAAKLVDVNYRHQLIQQLSNADEKATEWIDSLEKMQPDHRDALAFLLVNMPVGDLKSLPTDRIAGEIDLAYRAEAELPWGKQIPADIFLNDVLPYANTSEARDAWRDDFHNRFLPLVKKCKTAGEAVQTLNREVFKALNVRYHATKRQKPDQSPKESVAIGYASCTGLSIILVDACRSVGIPARIVGTPMWSDNTGNHTWVEIWDGRWFFVGAAEPGPFNETWFKAQASKANGTKPEYSIYAASYRRTGTPFLAVWAAARTDLFAENVTSFYTGQPTR